MANMEREIIGWQAKPICLTNTVMLLVFAHISTYGSLYGDGGEYLQYFMKSLHSLAPLFETRFGDLWAYFQLL